MTAPEDEDREFAAALFGTRRQPTDEREMANIIFAGGDRYTDASSDPVPAPDPRDGNHVPREGMHVARPVDPNHAMRLFARALFPN